MRLPRHSWMIAAVLLFGRLAAANEPAEQIVHRAWVPNGLAPQGEVRVVERQGAAVVQTVLWTRFLPTVAERIAAKERKGWGDDASALAYISALNEAVAWAERTGGDSGRAILLIEFIADADGQRVVFGLPSVVRGDDGLVVDSVRAFRTLAFDGGYVVENQRRIVQDTFGKHAPAVLNRLERIRQGVIPKEASDESR